MNVRERILLGALIAVLGGGAFAAGRLTAEPEPSPERVIFGERPSAPPRREPEAATAADGHLVDARLRAIVRDELRSFAATLPAVESEVEESEADPADEERVDPGAVEAEDEARSLLGEAMREGHWSRERADRMRVLGARLPHDARMAISRELFAALNRGDLAMSEPFPPM